MAMAAAVTAMEVAVEAMAAAVAVADMVVVAVATAAVDTGYDNDMRLSFFKFYANGFKLELA